VGGFMGLWVIATTGSFRAAAPNCERGLEAGRPAGPVASAVWESPAHAASSPDRRWRSGAADPILAWLIVVGLGQLFCSRLSPMNYPQIHRLLVLP